MDVIESQNDLLTDLDCNSQSLSRKETGVVARLNSIRSKATGKRIQEPAAPSTLPLFSAYQITLDDSDLGNLVSIYDALPRFAWSGKTVRSVAEMTIVKEGTINGEPFRVILKAVPMQKRLKVDGKLSKQVEDVGVFPGAREEFVEEALRKFSTQGNAKFNEAECSVQFTLYELQKELQSQKHTYTYAELREALEILSEAPLTIQTRTADGEVIDIKSTYLPFLAIRSRNKRSSAYVQPSPDDDPESSVLCKAVLHPLISRSIANGDYRLYQYTTSMGLTNGIARVLYRMLSFKWRNASPSHPFTFSLVDFLSNTARGLSNRMPEDFRAMNIALEQLVKEKAIQRYEHTKIAKSKGKGAKDYTYKLWPTNEFVSTIIKGHQAEARREIQLMAKRAR
ncbi:TPA: replication protein [Pseudomonas aeruginosa]|nr:replication protein [Pseudomonas aeruginosa]